MWQALNYNPSPDLPRLCSITPNWRFMVLSLQIIIQWIRTSWIIDFHPGRFSWMLPWRRFGKRMGCWQFISHGAWGFTSPETMQVIATGAQVGCRRGGGGLAVPKVMGPNCETPKLGSERQWYRCLSGHGLESWQFMIGWRRCSQTKGPTCAIAWTFATSGLMLVALNQQAAKHASALFRKREVGPNSQSRVAMCERYVLHVPAILLSTNLTTPTVIDCFQTRLHIKGFPFDTWSYLSILIIDSLHTNYTHVKSTTILLACQVHKFYQALVLGHPPVNWDGNGNRLCDRLRDVPGRFARSVAGAEGQAAETTVKVLQRGQWPKALGTFFWGVFVHTFSLNI